jgi:short-subunit dehydrogenase
MRDKNIVITGASSGIGAYLARELADRGAGVGLLARRQDRLEELAEELRQRGGKVAFAAADVTDPEALHRALDSIAEELGGVEGVVANAGYGLPEPPHKFTPERSQAMYDVNLFGMLHTLDWAIPRFLKQESGHIVGVASVASYLGMPNSYSYCGSKAAMRVHLQALRLSLKPYGIPVTTICPGFVESELTDSNKFKMPFLWKTDRAARKIADDIEKQKAEVIFPWQMALFIFLMTRLLPRSVTEWLLSRRLKKR